MACVPEGCPLTPTQFLVLQRICEGLTYKQVALERARSPKTIRQHVHAAYQRLGVSSSHQALTLMGRRGWADWKPPPDPDPLQTNPFLRAYITELDAWLASGMRDNRARIGMRLAIAGQRNRVNRPK